MYLSLVYGKLCMSDRIAIVFTRTKYLPHNVSSLFLLSKRVVKNSQRDPGSLAIVDYLGNNLPVVICLHFADIAVTRLVK